MEEPTSISLRYENLTLSSASVRERDTLHVELDVTNSGARAGAEVVQFYVRPPQGPKRVLRAFRRIPLGAGAKERVSVDLAVTDLAHYDPKSKRNVVDPGSYELLVGASSADIRSRATFEVTPR